MWPQQMPAADAGNADAGNQAKGVSPQPNNDGYQKIQTLTAREQPTALKTGQ